MFVIMVLKRVPFLMANPLILFPIAVAGSILAASLSYRFFESPILKLKSKFSSHKLPP